MSTFQAQMWWSAPSTQNSSFTEFAILSYFLEVVASVLPGAPIALNLNKRNLRKRKILLNVVTRIV